MDIFGALLAGILVLGVAPALYCCLIFISPKAFRRGWLLALSLVGCGLPFFFAQLAMRGADSETYGSSDPDPRTAFIASVFGYFQIALVVMSFAWGEWRKIRAQRANGDSANRT
jgi:hypothetical protein